MSTESFSADDILALVAHDLKSPLSAVRGYIELVEQAGELNEKQARYCKRALVGLDRVEHIIFTMLEMARLEDDELTLELGNCDLAALTRSALDLVEVERGTAGGSYGSRDRSAGGGRLR